MEHKKISYTERFFLGGEPDALQEGAFAMSKDISYLLNKYSNKDHPLLLACIRMTIPQIERIIGESGVASADELCEAMLCVATTKEVER